MLQKLKKIINITRGINIGWIPGKEAVHSLESKFLMEIKGN